MFFKYNIPGIIWAIIIFILCTSPGGSMPRFSFNFIIPLDKTIHIILFGVFCFLLILGFAKQYAVEHLRNHPILIATIVTIAYGISIELLQKYVFVSRSFEWMDIVADSSGAFLSILVYCLLPFKNRITN